VVAGDDEEANAALARVIRAREVRSSPVERSSDTLPLWRQR